MWGSHYEMLALGSCQTVPIHPIGSAWMPTAIKVCSHSHRQQVKQQMWSSFSTASRCGSTAPSCRVQSSRQCLPEMYYVHYPHMSAIAATPKASEPVLFKPTGFVHDRIPDSSYFSRNADGYEAPGNRMYPVYTECPATESITDGTTFFSSCICAFCAQFP